MSPFAYFFQNYMSVQPDDSNAVARLRLLYLVPFILTGLTLIVLAQLAIGVVLSVGVWIWNTSHDLVFSVYEAWVEVKACYDHQWDEMVACWRHQPGQVPEETEDDLADRR